MRFLRLEQAQTGVEWQESEHSSFQHPQLHQRNSPEETGSLKFESAIQRLCHDPVGKCKGNQNTITNPNYHAGQMSKNCRVLSKRLSRQVHFGFAFASDWSRNW